MIKTAEISADGLFRYRLERDWTGPLTRRTVTFVMLNPSTADANLDDPTIRRCIGFAETFDFTRLLVVNLFAFRATSPKDLTARIAEKTWAAEAFPHAAGVENPAHLRAAALEAEAVVFAWGAYDPPSRSVRGLAIAAAEAATAGRPVFTLGTTKSGAPKHPLYLAADTRLVSWK